MQDRTLQERFDARDPEFHTAVRFLNNAAAESTLAQKNYVCSVKDVSLARNILNKYVIVELDKNTGKLACLCPVRYHRKMKKMFIDDIIHYEPLPHLRVPMIIDEWSWVYDTKGWDTIAPIVRGDNAQVPFAHILPKSKDTTRYRPIVSYAKHPLKKVMSVCQRAIMYIISTLPQQHFNLPRTQDFLNKMTAFSQQMKFLHGESVLLLPFSLDIKEMFTGLPHLVIRTAVRWLLDHAKTCTRSVFIRVPKDKKMSCAWGKSSNLAEVLEISFQQVFEVVNFDLTHAIFTVGSHLTRQKQGAPIGGVISTSIAIATCVYSEVAFISTLGVDAKFLRVIRYVDDITGVVAFFRNDPESFARAKGILRNLQTECYPKPLLLKPEPIDQGSFRFLETLTTVQGNTVVIRHHNKNYESLRTTCSQKYYTIQHAHSFSPMKSKYGVVISRLIAISNHCVSDLLLKESIQQFFYELRFLCYSNRFIRRVCQHMYRNTDLDIWLSVSPKRRK